MGRKSQERMTGLTYDERRHQAESLGIKYRTIKHTIKTKIEKGPIADMLRMRAAAIAAFMAQTKKALEGQ